MGFDALAWAFAAAVTLHNAEEAMALPAWSRRAGRWHVPVGAREFRFATAVLTLLVWAAAAAAAWDGAAGAYAVGGYALAMAGNAFAPHLAATLALRRYAPGTASALVAVLPVSVALLSAGFAEGRLEWRPFLWTGPLVVLTLLASIPALFALGRAVFPSPADDDRPAPSPGA